MRTYTQTDLLRVARRVNNPKRNYLLVNPLQAKHLPVSPAQALEMMHTLGDRLAERYPETKLVIGFAETATAVGAAIASRFPGECVYLPTTREEVPEAGGWVQFTEEHSHAVQQKLCRDRLAEWIAHSRSILFVDDEISTGKTLCNMLRQLEEQYPELRDRQLVAASLINRVGPEDEQRLSQAGVRSEYLLKCSGDHAAETAAGFQVEEAAPVEAAEHFFFPETLDCAPLPDPRTGLGIGGYLEHCRQMAAAFLGKFELAGSGRAVVLGTEECMYPALILGRALEERGWTVRCHATTRSPIGVSGAPGYPIRSGCRLPSFYDGGRNTYLYNLEPCEVLIVVSDTGLSGLEALNALASAWEPLGCQNIVYLQGGRNVWYL